MPSSKSSTSPPCILMKSKKLPLSLRIRMWAGRYIYLDKNECGMDNVLRLPFGKIVKFRTTWNEAQAMEYVRKHTSVPVPKIYKVFERNDSYINIVMEYIPGDKADFTAMSAEEIQKLGEQLANYLDQLRSLEPPEPGFIGSATQESLLDHRLGHYRFGPFHSVADFHAYLRFGGALEEWLYDPVVKKIHGKSSEYQVKFTHADLNPKNIRYRNGRITAIIDWECAGWYPEYWEYTKIWFADHAVYQNFLDAVDGSPRITNYTEELQAERDIWRRISPWRSIARTQETQGRPGESAAADS
ncbi:kinase-like domain [Cordyceps militaris]|uniref:Kinase-like domain n=1 Tax=Cordyceps militaris TaxID=73501 RepID=A0A2H4SGT7_CORMI|nr:kinase-like domain [Cordyceps militaris]